MLTLSATAALILALACLTATFGWRTFAHWRATGTTGFIGVAGGPGSPAWWGAMLFVLSAVLMLTAPMLALLGPVAPPTGWPHPLVAVADLFAALAGIALAVIAQHEMGVAWRIGVDAGKPTTLITNGMFAHIRNPFFTAMITVAAGLAALVPTALSALAVICLIAAVEIQVRSAEEPYLIATHGSAYTTYAAHTGRFLPYLGRLTASKVQDVAGTLPS